MLYSSSSIEIDINNQINEFQEEERGIFLDKQQLKIFVETADKEDKMKIDDSSTDVDSECLSRMHTRIIVDVS